MHRLSVYIFLICFGSFTMQACSQTSGPEAVVEAFFTAVEEKDTDAAINCFKPELRKPYRASLQLSAELFNTDMSSVLSCMAGIPIPPGDTKLNYRICEVKQQDPAHANVTVLYSYSGRTDTREAVFFCIRIGRKWFLDEHAV